MRRSPAGPPLLELRTRERDDEEREGPRPLEEVFDEVEQGGIGPLHVLEHEDRRVDVGEPLEEQAPGGEQVVPLEAPFLEREQVTQTGLDEAALLGVGQMLLDDLRELRERARRLLVLGDARAPAHHVGKRPVGDALAVGEAAAAMPVRDLGEPVEVLVELPRKPGLADAADARDRDQLRLALVGARVEEILDSA